VQADIFSITVTPTDGDTLPDTLVAFKIKIVDAKTLEVDSETHQGVTWAVSDYTIDDNGLIQR
jgi:hypothetical protein